MIRYLEKNMQNEGKTKKYILLFILFVAVIGIPCWKIVPAVLFKQQHHPVIRIGTANFTEQIILGEILAQWIEQKTSLQVERKFNLGASAILTKAIQEGEIDLFPAYTGTA